MPAPEIIHRLVEQFTRNYHTYKSDAYNETQLRQEFLNPFFEALGWDVSNEKGWALKYREVIHEDRVEIDGSKKAPDYAFRIGGVRKYFVEAKKPAENIQKDASLAFQLRRYAWNAHLPLSILTDFEEFAVYDCRNKPNPNDSVGTSRIMIMGYEDYIDRWDEIASVFSYDAIVKGDFDRFAEDNTGKRGTIKVDDAFLNDIEEWRLLLARNIALRNSQVEDERQLNFAVQMTIDRLIFLRICEDLEIEEKNQLKEISQKSDIYGNLLDLFYRADLRYNSGLFHFKSEKRQNSEIDSLSTTLVIDDKVLKEIIKDLYYPSPYIFNEIPVEILGQVYEQFLGKVIRLTPGHRAKVEEKPEVRKAGGVYYTPKYIVDYIVENTVGELVKGKTPKQVAKLKIVDPACGSGSFLLGAYQFLLDWHEKWYLDNSPEDWAKGDGAALAPATDGGWRISTDEKKRILLNNIYGVDIDPQAVEVTKLSLLLKVLEGETGQLKLGFERVLPDLGANIKCGNSLIGSDYYDDKQIGLFDREEMFRINAFDWERAFPSVFSQGGFDAVIGNPPYVFARSQGIPEEEKNFYYKNYELQKYQLNTYSLFIERAYKLLNKFGRFGFIVPNNWLTIKSAKKLRDFIVSNSQDLKIINNNYKVFSGASVDTSIITFIKAEPTAITLLSGESPKNLQFVSKNSPDELLLFPIIPFISDDEKAKRSIISRIMEISVPLGEITRVKSGLKAYETGKGNPPQTDSMKKQRVYHSRIKHDDTYRKYLQGKDVNRYSLKWSEEYLKYGENLAAPRSQSLFSQDRILVRQIPSKPPYSINGVFVNDESINDINSMIILNPKNEYSIFYILGLINSRLLSFWFDIYYGKFQRRIFPQFKVYELAKFPIHIIDFSVATESEIHDSIVRIVKYMLDLHKRTPQTPFEQEQLKREITMTDKEIDRLVYELYELTEDEIRTVEESVA